MSITDILVHLDGGSRCAVRVALAARLAERHGARLTGLHAEISQAHRVGVVATWPSEDHLAAVAAARAAFEAVTAGLGDKRRFIDVNRGGEAEILARVTDYARTFDLVVLGQSEPGTAVPIDLPDQIIQEAGRPVLVVPSAGHYDDLGARPLFAWTRSRGAARALYDAVPLVAPKAEALVVHAHRPGEEPDEFAPFVVDALAGHGVAARFESMVVEEVKLMDMLLNRAADHDADLLAIGAFDHPGLPFLGRGTGTRHVLRHMTLPVLFSH